LPKRGQEEKRKRKRKATLKLIKIARRARPIRKEKWKGEGKKGKRKGVSFT